MKIRLPKSLSAALLAAIVCQPTMAGYFQTGAIFGTAPTQSTIKATDIPVTSDRYAPSAKDGNTTLTLEDGGTIGNALYIREGALCVKNNDVDIQGTNANGKGYLALSIAGKNSSMEIDGAVVTIKSSKEGSGACAMIGGMDGSGSLSLDNAAELNIEGGYSIFIGYSGYLDKEAENVGFINGHASTATTTGDVSKTEDRYVGTYVSAASGKYGAFGQGIVNVMNGSSLKTGYWGALYMASGVLNIGKDSTVISAQRTDARDINVGSIGHQDGCTSEINIIDGGSLLFNTGLVTGRGHNSRSTINVSGEDSTLTLNMNSYLGRGWNLSFGSYSNDWIPEDSKTVINLTDGGKAKVKYVSIGTACSAVVNVGQGSSITGMDPAAESNIEVEASGVVNNQGIIDVDKVTIEGGLLSMQGKNSQLLTKEVIEVSKGGTLEAAGGDPITVGSDVTVEDGGIISLKDGSTLAVTGALTMGPGSILRLSANDYAAGDTLLSSENGDLDVANATVEVTGGQANYIIKDGVIYLTAVFDNSIAEALTVTNWGIATASRTFVNAVRGQRTNTGCIANGRGTAWAAVLGATSDIGSGDVDLKGAAVGADMKVGEKSSLGVAFGYIDGDAKIPGMSKAEQEGTYVALYGEHGLRKLSATSCLSLDWVAAYGQTDTEWESADWEQQSLQLNTRLNWNKKLTDRLCMSVFGGLEYFTSESDRVENAKTGSIQNLRGEIGVGARYVAWGTPGSQPVLDEKGATIAAARPGCEKLVLHGEIRYMNDMVRSNPVIEQDGLRGSGDNPGRQGMGIEAGATYRISERWSASANYGFNTMEDSKEHRVNVGASYTF